MKGIEGISEDNVDDLAAERARRIEEAEAVAEQSEEVAGVASDTETIASLEATLEQTVQEAHAFYDLLKEHGGAVVTTAAEVEALDSYALALQERLAKIPPHMRAAEELPPYHPREKYMSVPAAANDNRAPQPAAKVA